MQNFDKFCYIFVVIMVVLDYGLTLFMFRVLGFDINRERNKVARFILANELWYYYFSAIVRQSAVMVMLVGMCRIISDRIDYNFPLILPVVLSSVPVMNNILVLIMEFMM